MRNTFIGISALAFFLIGCGGLQLIIPPAPTPTLAWTLSPSLSPTQPATVTPIAFPTYTPSAPPTETTPPTLTSTPTLTPELQWVRQGPDQVIVPILLYHHIGFSLKEENAYYIPPAAFEQQMNLLYQWGYRTISVELLVKAITEGAELPPKPILLTFDDGSDTTYSTALPILQRYGFTGVAYIVYNYIGLTHYMNTDQVRALYSAGWEVGSHGLSHVDLTARPARQEEEIVQSKRRLESLLGIPVLSFAYPFGAYNDDSLRNIHSAGYIAAMGLGNESIQGSKSLFYLSRRAVVGTEDLKTFASRLPWREEHYDLPALTIVP